MCFGTFTSRYEKFQIPLIFDLTMISSTFLIPTAGRANTTISISLFFKNSSNVSISTTSMELIFVPIISLLLSNIAFIENPRLLKFV